jgi:hypothetical protein
MLSRVLEVGATKQTLPCEWRDCFNRAAMPQLRTEGFNMSRRPRRDSRGGLRARFLRHTWSPRRVGPCPRTSGTGSTGT